jgi:hypothetical protein
MPSLQLESGYLGTQEGFNTFVNHLRKKFKKRIEVIAEAEADRLVKILVEETPVDTGFAVSNLSDPRVKRPPYKNHKALINGVPDPTGWQRTEVVRESVDRASVSIVNPMWDLYLKYTNMGYPNPKTAGFVQRAWARHLARRRKLGDKGV